MHRAQALKQTLLERPPDPIERLGQLLLARPNADDATHVLVLTVVLRGHVLRDRARPAFELSSTTHAKASALSLAFAASSILPSSILLQRQPHSRVQRCLKSLRRRARPP